MYQASSTNAPQKVCRILKILSNPEPLRLADIALGAGVSAPTCLRIVETLIEEGFVRMYAHDFAALAARAEGGSDVEALVRKRIDEARSHAALMDARKGEGHLPAVADRVAHEAEREDVRFVRAGQDVPGALARRKEFLLQIVQLLRSPPVAAGRMSIAVRG